MLQWKMGPGKMRLDSKGVIFHFPGLLGKMYTSTKKCAMIFSTLRSLED